MQRFFSIIVIFAILVLGGGWVFMKKSDESAKSKRAEDLASARKSFADKARMAARESDSDAYLRSMRGAIAAYNEELKKRVYGKDPAAFDTSAYKKDAEERFKKGEIKEADHKNKIEGYEVVKEAYDTLMSGNWKPVLTAAGKEFRVDIYDMKRAKTEEGLPVLEGKAFFWGVEDATRVNWGSLALRYWKVEKEKVKKGRETVEEDVEKVLGKADGEATPHVIVQKCASYIPEFPSYVSVGTVWFPVMPREATSVDIEYGFVAKTPGGDHDVGLKWEKFKIPSEWKLKEGESWEADVIEATEDEIAGKSAEQVEAEAAAAEKKK
jgi:hypothetical protein